MERLAAMVLGVPENDKTRMDVLLMRSSKLQCWSCCGMLMSMLAMLSIGRIRCSQASRHQARDRILPVPIRSALQRLSLLGLGVLR